MVCSKIPVTLMRAGTSRGLFIHREVLPEEKQDWKPILLNAIGSQLGDAKQLEGLGGGSSTTSKVAVISKSNKQGIDVEYTFVQIDVGTEKIDMTGTCGNMISGVGPFALDEGMVTAKSGQTEITISIYDTNTESNILETIEVDSSGNFQPNGNCKISGVKRSGSPIDVTFVSPAGSVTGMQFPTGHRQQFLQVPLSKNVSFTVNTTMIDISNPFIFVDYSTMPALYKENGPESSTSLELVESIRRAGAVSYGLASSMEEAALTKGTPKIAILMPSTNKTADIYVTAYSMGKLHPSLQLTGSVCLGACVCIPGTIAYHLSTRSNKNDVPDGIKKVLIQHGQGPVEAYVNIDGDIINSVTVRRTARRVFDGYYFYYH